MKFKFFVLISLFILLFNNVFSSQFIYENNESSIATSVSSPTFSFQSFSQVLMEPISGKIIYKNNENEKIYPASVTKIMTLLLTMEAIDSGKLKYNDKIICSANASNMGGSQIWFKENEELTVDEALKAICVVSANDVTMAISEHLGGSEENFVKMMNEKAKELGMKNTNFVNCHGIDNENHYTTAMDIAIMSKELITKHKDILKYTSIWMDTLRNGTFNLNSTNKLIRFYKGANGLKTGFTSKAMYNLSGSATRDNTSFIAVVCKAPSSNIRLNEVKQLLDYGFSNYENVKIFEKNKVLEEINIDKNINKKCKVGILEDVSYLMEKGRKIETSYIIKHNNKLIAPMKKNDIIGFVDVINKENNEKIMSKEIYLLEDVNKSSYLEYLKKILK